MALVSFKTGLRASLPTTHKAGTWYVCTDSRELYLDINDTSRIRIGDFQEFANVAALEANTNPSTTALYYVTDINCLAKWTGSEYIQINKDTGFTTFSISGEGNAVTNVSIDATDGRKLVFTKGATYLTEADVDSKLSEKIGDLGTDYANVKAYVDAKTQGVVTDAALDELQTKVDETADKVTALEEANAEGGAVAEAIADAKKAGTDAQQSIGEVQAQVDEIKNDYLKGSDKTELTNAINLKASQADMDAANAEIAAIKGDYVTKAEKTELEAVHTDHNNRLSTIEGQIGDLSGAMHFKGVETVLPTDLTGYADGDVIVVGEKEYVFNDGAFVEFGDVSAEGERIGNLEGRMTAVETKAGANETAIATEKSARETAVAELQAADTTNLQAAQKYADDAVAALKIEDYMKTADADAAYAPINHNHDEVYDAKGAAAAAQAAAEATAAADAETKANAALTSAQAYADQAELDAIAAAKVHAEELLAWGTF